MRFLKNWKRTCWCVLMSVGLAALGAIFAAILYSRPVSATQPPPPIQYTLTVNKSGGGECTMFYIDSPGGPWTTPTNQQIQQSFDAGTWIDVGIEIECPCPYRFDHWLVNDEEVEDAGPHQIAGFYLIENTTAVAVFEDRLAVLTIYVDDPTPQSSDTHSAYLGDVGHTFWKLTGSCVPEELAPYLNYEFGFYPEVTPYSGFPYKTWTTVTGVLGDDRGTDSTHDRPYIIDYNGLIAALELTKDYYEGEYEYHVENFNCTDAAFAIMEAAGIEELPNAAGQCSHTFHTFDGNCPGVLGENLGP